jgi:hypothetical protein
MKRFQALVCAGLMLSTLGCAIPGERWSSQPVHPAAPAPAPAPAEANAHPRLEKAVDAAKTTLGIITLPVTLPYYIITTGCWPGPKC